MSIANNEELNSILSKYETVPDFLGTKINDINTRNNFGDQVIHLACIQGNIEDLKFFLKHGADINSVGEDGFTPIHYAVQQGNIDIVKILISNNVDLKVKNAFGETPEQLACVLDENAIMDLLNNNS